MLGDSKLKIMMTADLKLVKEAAIVFIPKRGGFVWVPSHPKELLPLAGSKSNYSQIFEFTGLGRDFFEPFINIASNMYVNSYNNKAVAHMEYNTFKHKFSLVKRLNLPSLNDGSFFTCKLLHQEMKLKHDSSKTMMHAKISSKKHIPSPPNNS